MTPDELKQAQEQLGLNNAALAHMLRVTVRAVEMWRQGVRSVPGPASAFLDHLLQADRISRQILHN